jgi:histidinol-phosphate aminotransferase
MKSLVREAVAAMHGYTPGEQPRDRNYIKLNTNENPYPPSPAVACALREMDTAALRLYPDPTALALRTEAAKQCGLEPDWVLCGNGSDDLLTMSVRTFVDQGQAVAFPNPTYSLYPVLADIQGAAVRPIELTDTFDLPHDFSAQTADAALLFIARPNAPTGNCFSLARLHEICGQFKGAVWIDEAYVDFAEDHCLDFVRQYPNVIVSRTFSKSYSLAGVRLGLAFGQPPLIAEMQKVKDSYNVNAITQRLGLAALRDRGYMLANADRIRATRTMVAGELAKMGFQVLPSQANFLFVKPPVAAESFMRRLRENGILIRHFSGPRTQDFVRISIGTDEEMQHFLQATKSILC